MVRLTREVTTLFTTGETDRNTSADAPVMDARGGRAIVHPLADDLVELVADRFRALAEPTRIKLLDRLRGGEATVLELTALVGTTQQNVSKHLSLLQHAGIVARRKQGNFAYYRISDDSVPALCEVVCGSLANRADTLRRGTGA